MFLPPLLSAEAMPMSEFTGQQMVVEMRLVTGDNNTQVTPCGLNEPNIEEKYFGYCLYSFNQEETSVDKPLLEYMSKKLNTR